MSTVRKTKFTIDNGEQFEGYTKGNLWNGWECPYFTKEVSLEIVAWVNKQVGILDCYYDESNDTFIFVQDNGFEDKEIFTAEEIKYESEVIKVYPIGSWSWIWDEIEK